MYACMYICTLVYTFVEKTNERQKGCGLFEAILEYHGPMSILLCMSSWLPLLQAHQLLTQLYHKHATVSTAITETFVGSPRISTRAHLSRE